MNLFKRLLNWIKQRSSKSEPVIKGRVAICVGHSRVGDRGASSIGGVPEWVYNTHVAKCLRSQLKERGFASQVFNEYPRPTYRQAVDWVASRTTSDKFDVVLELHFNSYDDGSVSGYEYLHHYKSEKGKALAIALNEAHKAASAWQKERGARPVKIGQRGFRFLSKVGPPAVICEPFFGSSPQEWRMLLDAHEQIAEIYADGIEQYFGNA